MPRRAATAALPLPDLVVLVLQGGGALGAFQAGVYEAMIDLGIDKQPLGIDIMELPMLRALEAAGTAVPGPVAAGSGADHPEDRHHRGHGKLRE